LSSTPLRESLITRILQLSRVERFRFGLAFALAMLVSGPACSGLLIAAGGGGGAGYWGGNAGGNGQAGTDGQVGFGLFGGIGGSAGGGGGGAGNWDDPGGTAPDVRWNGGGGGGWLGAGGAGLGRGPVAEGSGNGGSGAPTFAPGAGAGVGGHSARGGFGGGGGGGWQGGGGGGGYSGGGGGGAQVFEGGIYRGGGGGGGGGSFIDASLSVVRLVGGFNGASDEGAGSGRDGYVVINGLRFSHTGGFASYAVPTTGVYDIIAVGAQGGHGCITGIDCASLDEDANIGGYGALIEGLALLSAGTVLNIAVGGGGRTGNFADFYGGGGGGGSFVWIGDPTPAAMPEPGSLALLAAALLVFGVLTCRRRAEDC
jgi:hypothetical protein